MGFNKEAYAATYRSSSGASTLVIEADAVVPKWVRRHVPILGSGYLLLCLLAAATGVMGQTYPSSYVDVIPVGTNPSALGINPTTNMIYVVNSGGKTVSVINGGNLTAPQVSVTVGNIPSDAVVNPVTNKIYVSNDGDGTISVIDGANPTTASTAIVKVGTNPVAGAMNRVTNTYYVANEGSNSVSVINGATNEVTDTITVGTSPHVIALNPVTNKIYVANNTNVSVIDGTNLATAPVTVPAGTNPTAIAVNPVTNKIYVANSGSNNVTVIDGATNGVVTTVVAGTTPNAIGVNPVTNKVYVVNNGSNNVTVIDGATDTPTAVAVGPGPVQIGVNSLTDQVYVSNNNNTMSVIDGATGVVRTITNLSATPYAIAVNPVTNKVFATNLANKSVTVIDGDINDTSSLPAGALSNPYGVAVNPVTNKIYVTNSSTDNSSLLVIDGATNTVSATVPAGAEPFAIAVNPVTNTIYLTNNPITRGSVTVINGADNSIVATVPAGLSPNYVAVNPVTNKIYASDSSGNMVYVIDGSNPTVTLTTVTVGNRPNGIAIDQARNKLYVANIGDNTREVWIDGATNTETKAVPVSTQEPFFVALNPVTNKVYVAGSLNGNIVSVIDGASDEQLTSVTAGSGAYRLGVNAVTNKIYVANQFDSSVTVIDGATDLTTPIQLIPNGAPYAVAVNPVTNKVYVSTRTSNVVTVIDGASDILSANIPAGNSPYFLDVNTATNRIYAANYIGDTVTTIDADGHLPVPLTTVITGVVDSETLPPQPSDPAFQVFQTVNATPSFTVNVTSAYSATGPYRGDPATNPPPTQLYYEVDGFSPSKLATATSAAGANPTTYTITLPPQQTGLHTLYVYAAYGNEAGQTSGGVGNGDSPEMGSPTAYPYLVTLSSTTTTVTSSANPQGAGENVAFTATVVPILLGPAGPTGTVSFYDGTTLLGTGTVSLGSGGYVATYTTSSLTQGSPTITATYSGDTAYFGSSGTLTQTITGPPASITASGGGQTTVYGTPFANPLMATVKDSLGAAVPGATVTFAGTGLSFAPQTATTDANGVAQVSVSANAAGSFTATASVSGVTTPATFSLTATKAVLTVKANDDTRGFGQPNPTFTALITGFVNGDTEDNVVSGDAALSTPATQASPPAPYLILAAAGTLAAANYTFIFVNGTLTVTAAIESTTTLSVAPAAIMYGDEVVLSAVVAPAGATGLVRFFESTSDLEGSASLDGTGTAVLPVRILPAGEHNITAEYTGDSSVPPSTSNTVPLTVLQLTAPGGGPALTVKVNDATRTTTEPNPPFTYSTSGTLVNGDTYATAIMGTPIYTTSPGDIAGDVYCQGVRADIGELHLSDSSWNPDGCGDSHDNNSGRQFWLHPIRRHAYANGNRSARSGDGKRQLL